MTWYVTPLEDWNDGHGIRSIGTASTAAELADFAGTVEATIRSGDNPIGHLHHLELSPRQRRDALRVGAHEHSWLIAGRRHRHAHGRWLLANCPDQSIYDPPTPDPRMYRYPKPRWVGIQGLARSGRESKANKQLRLM